MQDEHKRAESAEHAEEKRASPPPDPDTHEGLDRRGVPPIPTTKAKPGMVDLDAYQHNVRERVPPHYDDGGGTTSTRILCSVYWSTKG